MPTPFQATIRPKRSSTRPVSSSSPMRRLSGRPGAAEPGHAARHAAARSGRLLLRGLRGDPDRHHAPPARRCRASDPGNVGSPRLPCAPMSGRAFLQIPGPTNIPDRVLRAMDRPVVDHRGPEFAQLTEDVRIGLRRVFGTQGGAPMLYPASGTGATEAALVNALAP